MLNGIKHLNQILKLSFVILALSIINYITGIGISVEFTAHMTSAYLGDKGRTRFERVKSALKSMGPAVLAGVTMTNLPGMIVLKFATAKIIEVYTRLIKICKDSLCKKFILFFLVFTS